MLNVRTSIIDGAPSPASAGSVQPEGVSFPSNVQALSALVLGVLLVLGAIAALVAVQRRRRSTAHCAALLAGSAPVGLTPAGAQLANGGSSGAIAAGASSAVVADDTARSKRAPIGDEAPGSTRTSIGDSAPRSSRGVSPAERSSPRAAAAPSGINVPPPSERQWQSQPPPRIGKEPPG
jgi:hypothetical protein